MKPWLDLDSVPMPSRISILPKDDRGYPIPYTAATRKDGTRDFTVIDETRSHHCFTNGFCGICGGPLGRHRAFVGGGRSIINRIFTDVWMHRECAEYALKVCPFLAAPSFAYSRKEADSRGHEAVLVNDSMDTNRPQVFGLGITDRARYAFINQGQRVMQAGAWSDTTWWHRGKEITQEEVVAILKEAGQ